MNKRIKTKVSLGAGLLTGGLTRIYIHEPGHWAMAKLVNILNPEANLEPEMKFYNPILPVGGRTIIYGEPKWINYKMYDAIISAGGCAFNYLAGLGFGYIARKLDKKTHPKTKAFLTGISIVNSVYPAYYAILDKLNIAGNDFWWLNKDGIPYEVTIPLTFAISAGLVYYNIRGWKDTVEKMTKRVNYYGLPWREKRRKWKEKKEKIIEEFERYFEGDKRSRRKAKKAFKKLNKIEVVGDEYKDKDLKKFGEYLGLDLDEAKELVERYVWEEFDDPEMI